MQCGANETLDVLLDGRVRIIQRRDGYRVNQDSLRLCRFVRPMPRAAGVDLGAGCGILSIILVLEGKVKRMVALEFQESLADLARRNVALNELGGSRTAGEAARPDFQTRIEVIRGDIRKASHLFEPHSFDLAVSNPPFRPAGRGRMSPSAEKSIARHEQECSLEDLIRAAAYLLRPEGVFAFCQLRERWQEIAEKLQRYGLQVTRREDEGEVVLVEARKAP